MPDNPAVIDDGSTEPIFISIVSYCDPLLDFTLRSAVQQASHPQRIHIGLVEQHLPADCVQLPDDLMDKVRRVHVHPLEARGPCWARAIAMSLHQGEPWFLQVDSHTWFEPGWDDQLVRWGKQCSAMNPLCVITTYPRHFDMQDGTPVARPSANKVLAQVVRGDQEFSDKHPVLMFEAVHVDSDTPVLGMHVGGNFLFAPGRFVNDIPYDPFLYFHGEEHALALRAWTRGWDIFHVPGVPLLHHYLKAGSVQRLLHWSPEFDAQRRVRSADLNRAAHARLRALLWEGADLGIYGLGTARSLADYTAFSGIDYAARHIAATARRSRFGY